VQVVGVVIQQRGRLPVLDLQFLLIGGADEAAHGAPVRSELTRELRDRGPAACTAVIAR
jgi:hypothetical protein